MDYTDELLFHYKNPQNTNPIKNPSVKVDESNPVCGDEIHLELKIENNVVENVYQITKGCAICSASMSILSERLLGMKISDIKKITNEDIYQMLGIEISPGRVKCALLSLVSTKKAILIFENPNLNNSTQNHISCSH